jgi:hypothetical protein
MDAVRTGRDQCRALDDQLIAEYAGGVPPGLVLATVLRAHLVVARQGDLHVSQRMHFCETIARRLLTERIAGWPLVRQSVA